MRKVKTPSVLEHDDSAIEIPKKINNWAHNYSTRDNTLGNSLEFDQKHPSKYEISGFNTAKVTMAHKIPIPVISPRKKVFNME